MKNIFNHFRAV